MAILSVVALGDLPRGLFAPAAQVPSELFGLGAKVLPPLASPKYAWNPEKKAHHGASILRKLVQLAPPKDGVVLGVGAVELFDPDTGHELADHDRDLRAAVLGVNRLEPSDELRAARRLGALAAWAVGRALGLSDCEDRRCALSAPETPEMLDGRVAQLCPACKAALARPGAASAP